jgi:hypothetical protein
MAPPHRNLPHSTHLGGADDAPKPSRQPQYRFRLVASVSVDAYETPAPDEARESSSAPGSLSHSTLEQ